MFHDFTALRTESNRSVDLHLMTFYSYTDAARNLQKDCLLSGNLVNVRYN